LGPNLDLCCRRWHPAKLGGAPYRQLCPAYPSADRCRASIRHSSSPRDRAKGSAGTFQRGKLPALTPLHRKRISQKLYRKFPHTFTGTHGTQQAWINSRNLTNIATEWKHRQPMFLHPTVGTGVIRPSRSMSTLDCRPELEVLARGSLVSRRIGASRASDNRAFGSLPYTKARHASLLNPSPFSTLKVFHSSKSGSPPLITTMRRREDAWEGCVSINVCG